MRTDLIAKFNAKLSSLVKSAFTSATKIVIRPEETINTPQSFFPAGHLDRVISTDLMTSKTVEIARIMNPLTKHAPTAIYHFNRAIVRKAHISTTEFHLSIPALNSKIEFLESTPVLIPSNSLSSKFFGHFVHDDIPSYYLANELNLKYCVPYQLNFPHATQFFDLLNFFIPTLSRGIKSDLYIASDFSQNSHKASRYHKVRQLLRSNQPPRATSSSKCVYIKRGRTGSPRILINEDILIDRLSNKGWDIIDPAQLNLSTIFEQLLDAKVVLSVEGSALAHSIFTISIDGALIVLQPPQRFTCIYKGIMDSIGIKFGFYVCAPGPDSSTFYIDDFNSLDRLINEVLEKS